MKTVYTFLRVLLITLVLCLPTYASILDDPCGCDPALLKIADKGDVEHQSYVAKLYLTGKNDVQKDYEKARYWYQRVIDNQNADAKIVAHANLFMGILYNSGKGGKQCYISAMKCFQAAAKQGYYDAHISIGKLYVNGLGVKKDYNQAMYWWKIAAENKHPSAPNLISLLEKRMNSQIAAVQKTAKNNS